MYKKTIIKSLLITLAINRKNYTDINNELVNIDRFVDTVDNISSNINNDPVNIKKDFYYIFFRIVFPIILILALIIFVFYLYKNKDQNKSGVSSEEAKAEVVETRRGRSSRNSRSSRNNKRT
jgi:hypothetical protein